MNGTFELKVENGKLVGFNEALSFLVNCSETLLDRYKAHQTLTIPGEVHTIGANSLHSYFVTGLRIEEGVEKLENSALSGLPLLHHVWIPASITEVPLHAFPDQTVHLHINYPAGLLKTILRSSWSLDTVSAEQIGFARAIKLAYQFPSKFQLVFHCQGLHDHEFAGCPIQATVCLESSFITAKNVFANSMIEEVIVGENVRLINPGVFGFDSEFEIPSLQAFHVGIRNPFYRSINGSLYKTDGTLIRVPHSQTGDFHVPDACSSIAAGAFYGCLSLETVLISKGVRLNFASLAGLHQDTNIRYL